MNKRILGGLLCAAMLCAAPALAMPGMGEGNRGHYSNAEVDALLDQASVETDQAKRAALVEQVDQIARDEAAYIPLFFKENIFGVRAGIQYTPSCDDHILAWDFTF